MLKDINTCQFSLLATIVKQCLSYLLITTKLHKFESNIKSFIMSSYRRAKKEDSIQPSSKEMTIKIGSVKDSFMSLKTMCNDKSVELQKTLQLNNEDKLDVVFWTADIPELIGISTFTKNKDGLISFNLNCDESTL